MERKMIIRKAFAVLVLALAFLTVLSDARASEWDQATKVTFNQSVQIPGKVLPAGTYWFVIPSAGIIQIFNSDRSTLQAMVLDKSAELQQPLDESTFTLENAGSAQPGVLVTWFYPGMLTGHAFLYSKKEQKEIAMAKQHSEVMGTVN
jgi:hypothetical protein